MPRLSLCILHKLRVGLEVLVHAGFRHDPAYTVSLHDNASTGPPHRIYTPPTPPVDIIGVSPFVISARNPGCASVEQRCRSSQSGWFNPFFLVRWHNCPACSSASCVARQDALRAARGSSSYEGLRYARREPIMLRNSLHWPWNARTSLCR